MRPQRMREIAGLDARAGAPVGAALCEAADNIERMEEALTAIKREAMRARGAQAHKDALAFAYTTARSALDARKR